MTSMQKAQLRILETTDLHMQLLGYDYFADRHDVSAGLIPLANDIATLRTDPHITTLLFDNGDFLQGNPLADNVAEVSLRDTTDPMIAAFNTLDYDAVTLGNHEFNYGLEFLHGALQQAKFPVVCANIKSLNGTALGQSFTVLERDLL